MKELKNLQNKSSLSWREIAQGKKAKNQKSLKNKDSKKAFIYKIGAYIRLSPSDEIREEGSLVSHPQQIRNFVQLKNSQSSYWGEVVEWYTDKDYSGGNMNRPAFKKMCADIVSGTINAVVITELSRLNRNVKDFCQFWDFAQRHNIKLISLKESFDTSTPAGEMMLLSIMNFAQFERKTIVQRIKNGSRSRAERGLANGGVPTLGYYADPNKTCHLLINEKEKSVVQLIFNTFIELGTLAKACEYLNQKGYTTKEYTTKKGKKFGGNRWTVGSLHRTLTNLVYISKREFNKKNRHLDQDNLKEDECYKVFDAEWSSIIGEHQFYIVQEMLEDNKKKTRKYVHNYRLSGFVHCKECGEKLIGKSATGRSGKYYYYGHKRDPLNHGQRHLNKCVLENIPALTFEEAVFSGLKRLKEDKSLLASLLNEKNSKSTDNSSYINGLLQSLREKHKVIRSKSDGLISAIAEAPKDKLTQTLIKKLHDLENEKEALEKEIENLITEKEEASGNLINLKSAFALLRSFNKSFSELPAHKQRLVLKGILHKVIVSCEGVYIECHGMAQSPMINLEADLIESSLKEENINIKKKNLPTLNRKKPEPKRTLVRPLSQLVEQE